MVGMKKRNDKEGKRNMTPTHRLCLCLIQGGKPDLNTALPIRQTASIFKQPVTKVTSHPSNKVKADLQRASEQPRQVRGRRTHTSTHVLVSPWQRPGAGSGCYTRGAGGTAGGHGDWGL